MRRGSSDDENSYGRGGGGPKSRAMEDEGLKEAIKVKLKKPHGSAGGVKFHELS